MVEYRDGKELVQIQCAGLRIFWSKGYEKRPQICHRGANQRITSLRNFFNKIFFSADFGRSDGNRISRQRGKTFFTECALCTARKNFTAFRSDVIKSANTVYDNAIQIFCHKNLISGPIPTWFEKGFCTEDNQYVPVSETFAP